MKHTSLTPAQRDLLETLAGGGIIAVVHTRGGTIASLFPREGRHRNISFKIVQPMLDAGWVEDVVPKVMRWRGSKFVINAKGLKAARSETDSCGEFEQLNAQHSEVGSS